MVKQPTMKFVQICSLLLLSAYCQVQAVDSEDLKPITIQTRPIQVSNNGPQLVVSGTGSAVAVDLEDEPLSSIDLTTMKSVEDTHTGSTDGPIEADEVEAEGTTDSPIEVTTETSEAIQTESELGQETLASFLVEVTSNNETSATTEALDQDEATTEIVLNIETSETDQLLVLEEVDEESAATEATLETIEEITSKPSADTFDDLEILNDKAFLVRVISDPEEETNEIESENPATTEATLEALEASDDEAFRVNVVSDPDSTASEPESENPATTEASLDTFDDLEILNDKAFHVSVISDPETPATEAESENPATTESNQEAFETSDDEAFRVNVVSDPDSTASETENESPATTEANQAAFEASDDEAYLLKVVSDPDAQSIDVEIEDADTTEATQEAEPRTDNTEAFLVNVVANESVLATEEAVDEVETSTRFTESENDEEHLVKVVSDAQAPTTEAVNEGEWSSTTETNEVALDEESTEASQEFSLAGEEDILEEVEDVATTIETDALTSDDVVETITEITTLEFEDRHTDGGLPEEFRPNYPVARPRAIDKIVPSVIDFAQSVRNGKQLNDDLETTTEIQEALPTTEILIEAEETSSLEPDTVDDTQSVPEEITQVSAHEAEPILAEDTTQLPIEDSDDELLVEATEQSFVEEAEDRIEDENETLIGDEYETLDEDEAVVPREEDVVTLDEDEAVLPNEEEAVAPIEEEHETLSEDEAVATLEEQAETLNEDEPNESVVSIDDKAESQNEHESDEAIIEESEEPTTEESEEYVTEGSIQSLEEFDSTESPMEDVEPVQDEFEPVTEFDGLGDSFGTTVNSMSSPLITKQPSMIQFFSTGEPFTLVCEASSQTSEEVKYSWTRNGHFLRENDPVHQIYRESLTNGNILFISPKLRDVGTYQCLAETSMGKSFSQASLLMVQRDSDQPKSARLVDNNEVVLIDTREPRQERVFVVMPQGETSSK